MFDFRLEDIEDVSFEPIPRGTYTLQVEKSEVQDTKSGNGKYISVEFNVISEEYNGRKIFEIFNVVNESEKAENIGKSQLKQLIVASGADIEVFTDAEQLIGLEVEADIVIKKDEGYDERNAVKKYKVQKSDMEGEDSGATDLDTATSGEATADGFD